MRGTWRCTRSAWGPAARTPSATRSSTSSTTGMGSATSRLMCAAQMEPCGWMLGCRHVDGAAMDTASSTLTANTSTWEQRIPEPLLLLF